MCRARMKRSRAAAGVFSKKHYFDNALSKDLLKLRYRPRTHSRMRPWVRLFVALAFVSRDCGRALHAGHWRLRVECCFTLHVATRASWRTA